MHLMFPPISIPVNCAARFPLDAFLANHNIDALVQVNDQLRAALISQARNR